MKSHIILAHPEPSSFNARLAGISERELQKLGYETTFSDLYQMGFDPCEGPANFTNRADSKVFHAQTEQHHSANENTIAADIEAEINNILQSDLLVVHFPLWWFGMPAILKGWMDRTFVYGRMYKSKMRYDAGICADKKIIACVTTGASADSCSFDGKEGDTNLHLWPLLFPFRYLGFNVYTPEIFNGIGGVAFVEGNEDGLKTIETFSSQWQTTLETLSERPLVSYNHDMEFGSDNRLLPGSATHSPFIRSEKDIL